jgi:phosphoribosyl-ATP pyrophosphohydrolase/phosphoribosyl-AMP cyclohydrolase
MDRSRLPSKRVKFDQSGLIPAVVQDDLNGEILMVAYMNRLALDRTLVTGKIHFFSRSRAKLWRKGETSGNELEVRSVFLDCDRDVVLVKARANGPACHTGRRSCFFQVIKNGRVRTLSESDAKSTNLPSDMLQKVFDVIIDRKNRPKKESYVSSLFRMGKDQILKKIGEEAGELIIGSKNNRREEVIHEMADLWFHSLVVMGYHSISLQDLYRELGNRFGKSGFKRSSNATEIKKNKRVR